MTDPLYQFATARIGPWFVADLSLGVALAWALSHVTLARRTVTFPLVGAFLWTYPRPFGNNSWLVDLGESLDGQK